MNSIEIYEPAMCCSTGVCGPTVDPALVRLAADVEWLKSQGVPVARFNLAQQPGAFSENEVVRNALDEEGALPLVVAKGRIVLRGCYPTRDQLATFAMVHAPAALSSRECNPSQGGTSCC